MNKQNLLGKKIHMLTVIGYVGEKEYKYPSRIRKLHIWKCVCECGNECEVNQKALIHDNKKSCGCLRSKTSAENCKKRSLPAGVAAIRMYFRNYKTDAKDRSHSFKLSLRIFENLIKDKCHYCNSPPSLLYPGTQGYSINGVILVNGIDRIDNTKGYIPGNVVTSCKICNFAKRNLSYEEFIGWINKLKKHDITFIKRLN